MVNKTDSLEDIHPHQSLTVLGYLYLLRVLHQMQFIPSSSLNCLVIFKKNRDVPSPLKKRHVISIHVCIDLFAIAKDSAVLFYFRYYVRYDLSLDRWVNIRKDDGSRWYANYQIAFLMVDMEAPEEVRLATIDVILIQKAIESSWWTNEVVESQLPSPNWRYSMRTIDVIHLLIEVLYDCIWLKLGSWSI